MESVTRRLINTAKSIRSHFELALAEESADFPTWNALQALTREPRLSQRQLADRMHLEGPTVTRHLDYLEQVGLIARHRDPVDRRVIRVEATTEGRRLHRRLRNVALTIENELMADMPLRDAAALLRALDHIDGKIEDTYEHEVG